MSDIDQEWKPKNRPQSTMAQAFSSALDSAFSLDSDVNHLSQTIDQKRHQMMIQERELEQLQARIREAEERLKARQSLILDGNNTRSPSAQRGERFYQSTASTSASTSPTDSAGQYSSGDEQQRGQGRNS
ncbi:hypothetical protein AAWM_01507 [Aspergillus awamori]|uniref:Uncharacterized protein n=5 Tax=Aspergillus TaxID=5052 RepID=A2QCS3_ASPNC|nr:hypothetical protein An02g04555 [Aspergillus niger]XP_025460966.1 uncharacterized protein BO96DRAFT_441335 [Aspergillus niger CBS 101883]XP_026623256.1 hypothetical protein BDQ94DRAFT_149255 [Aspergillus welwitschiae]RDH25310.1 hypothetical protein M747DRAFT_337126 [Aspergillus niger ATCC 13496]GCB18622.1 hypothetical protein AAWM_01507 [Aspergillus awamori]KAI2816917.1 hypothetical protein CBS115989_6391 [Aspergillus niger]KAI2825724.1 hypothetical protein CBS133816_8172 [Aspergillus nige|eukprot:XP_001399593.1 hypothetical protein ANI_1_646024 [Aspergillus niger CBS 513.88]